ncbi:glycosyltransferase family 52 protein [Vibrio harveyi]|uniref:polysialyltransferase family glycosyltransferase n=1 Tax=Vibrio harveyi TaxID=669 RepID=UPI003BB5D577
MIILEKISNEYEKVLLVESIYSISLFLHINKNISKDTLFIVGNNIYFHEIFSKIENYIIYDNHHKISKLNKLLINIGIIPKKYLKIYKSLKGKIIFGHDHLNLSVLIMKKKYNIIEDGIKNYIIEKDKSSIFGRSSYNLMGYNKFSNKIYLTSLMEIKEDTPYKNKISIINRDDFLRDSSKQFGGIFSEKVPNNCIILITQPFSEDGILSENEKINLYESILNKLKLQSKNIVIKPHPRETTNYSIYFKDTKILPSYKMMENITGNIDLMVTIFSSCAFNLKYNSNVKVLYLGTSINNKLKKKFGNIEGFISFND